MKLENYIEEIEIIWKKVQTSELKLANNINSNHKTKLRSFIEVLNDVKRSFTKVVTLHNKRQELIEFHCQDKPVPLIKHEEYHEVSDELHYEIKSFFSIYKTALNSLTILLMELIPEQDRRGIRTKSFGSLIDSLNTIDFEKSKLFPLIKILSEQGKMIDKEIMSYRDKMIEHPRNLSRGSLSTQNDTTKIIHTKDFNLETYPTKKVLEKKYHNIKIYPIKVQSTDSYIYYYHVNQEVKDGPIEKGKQLGSVFDNTTIHFESHGSHFHMFSSPDFKGDIMDSLGKTISEMTASPSPNIAWTELGNFTSAVLNELSILNN